MKNKFIKTSFLFITLLLMFSCAENDDYTGDSVLSVSSPSLEVSLGFSESETLVEAEESYDFTVSISETQAVDVIVYLEQTEGTATAGEDFSMPSSVTIKKGSLSASDVITIHEDEIIEDTETATIKIGVGNEANVSGVSSKTVNFNIANLTEGDLVVGMSWEIATPTTDDTGAAIDAYDFADLRLSLTNVPYTQILQTADGAADETYTLGGGAPDGEYYLVADIFDAMEDVIRDLNITLTFNQVGIINNQTHTFSNGLSTEYTCANNYLIMAKVTKSGENYTLEEIAENSAAPSIAGIYDVVSNGTSTDPGPTNNPLVDFPSTVEVTDNGDGTYTFSDGWAGVYVEWYTMYNYTFLEEQTITLTPCLDLSGAWDDAFGGANAMRGTVNADGTLSIEVANVYGDYVSQVYTLQ
jgi:hypothetical protein